jgi:hypothetical protein
VLAERLDLEAECGGAVLRRHDLSLEVDRERETRERERRVEQLADLALAQHFLARACADYGLSPRTLAADTRSYPLDSVFRSQFAATISDDQGRPTAILPFKPYQDYHKDFPQAEASSGTPSLYTVRSPESDAAIIVGPTPVDGNGAGKLVFLTYHTLIQFAESPNETLLVPQGVDDAIFWKAMQTFLAGRDASTKKLETAGDMVKELWPQVLFEFQDHSDPEIIPWNTPV